MCMDPEFMDENEFASGSTRVKLPTLRYAPAEGAKRNDRPTLLSFHGLRQQPFDVTPDPAYLYFSPSHREALTSLSDGIENFRGFMALVAEPGMGKTTLLNKLMDEIGGSARVVFLFQTQCTSNELLAFLLNELEVDHSGKDIVAMHRALNQVLLEEMLAGRRFVLIVDEAQNLQDSVLETIRRALEFEGADGGRDARVRRAPPARSRLGRTPAVHSRSGGCHRQGQRRRPSHDQ
jgi:type II secretory pathway predicted ATPase ExeA